MNKPALPFIARKTELALPALEMLAKTVAGAVRSGDMITLRGDLGAGKTTFTRGLIHALSEQPVDVTSPTFNLMQSYDVSLADHKSDTLWHLDLYRLDEPSEADALGLRDIESQVVVIEWPEIIEPNLPATRLDITIAFAQDMDKRDVAFYGNEPWKKRLASL